MEIVKYSFKSTGKSGEMGFLTQTSVRDTAPLHTHSFFEFFLVIDGKALHMVNDTVQNIEAGDLVFIRPSDVHNYDFFQTFDFVFINVAFPMLTMQKLSDFFLPQKPFSSLISSPLPPTIHLSSEETKAMHAELVKLEEMNDGESPDYARLQLRSFLARMFTEHFFSADSHDSSIPRWLSEANLQMQSIENFCAGFSRMLELCHCTPEHLCREFKKHYGTTPGKFINKQRLGYSLYLLSNTTMEIVEVCESCGFNNLSHFYHLFKESYGISPKKFRMGEAPTAQTA